MTRDDLERLARRLGGGRERTGHLVPGRIEVLGKHTDYAGGRSLLCPVDRGFAVAAAPREDGAVRLVDAGRGETVVLHDGGGPRGTGSAGGARTARASAGRKDGDDAGGADEWRIYPETVLRRVRRDFGLELRGCDLVFESDLPPAAGLSSSTALVTAVFLALDGVEGLLASEAGRRAVGDREALAAYLAAVERGSPYPGLGPEPDAGVGLRGGGEDHVAILCGIAGALVRYAYEPVRREGVVPVPEGLTFAVAASGVRARKTGAARERYNRLSDAAARAAELWRRETGGAEAHLGAILGDDPERAGEVVRAIRRAAEPGEREGLVARVEHFAAESTRLVPAASEALARGELGRFGELVDRSQRLAERLLENQVPETVALQRTARERGAAAASAFGAGFGGAVWALVEEPGAEAFLEGWRSGYLERFPGRRVDARFFTTPAAAPAREVPLGGP